jgi:hypothetical protein
VKNIIRGNCQLTVREFAEEVGIFIGSCHIISTEDLGMHQVPAKFVPRHVTDEEKLQRFSSCEIILQKVYDDENLLKNIITGDRTWI